MITACLALIAASAIANDAPLPPAEHGHGLKSQESREGWIALFDGQTSFGWENATVKDGKLSAGASTSRFANSRLRVKASQAGTLRIGDRSYPVDKGETAIEHQGGRASIRLEGVVVESINLRPLSTRALFNGKDFSGWTRSELPKLAESKRPSWRVEAGRIHAVGGPGALEHAGPFGDFILQLEVKSLAKYANGGVFLRNMPGACMMGYEAQVHSRCDGGDVSKPSRYATGGIDDRQNARRLISRDFEPFTMTILIDGPHLATWVNGYQTADWTDTRTPHDNPRQGLRLAPGTLQLQAHDPETDLEFWNIRIAELR